MHANLLGNVYLEDRDRDSRISWSWRLRKQTAGLGWSSKELRILSSAGPCDRVVGIYWLCHHGVNWISIMTFFDTFRAKLPLRMRCYEYWQSFSNVSEPVTKIYDMPHFWIESRPKLITLCKFVCNKPLVWLTCDEWTSHTAVSCQSPRSCRPAVNVNLPNVAVRIHDSNLGILRSDLGPPTDQRPRPNACRGLSVAGRGRARGPNFNYLFLSRRVHLTSHRASFPMHDLGSHRASLRKRIINNSGQSYASQFHDRY